jgi:hypothetical protein
MVKKDILWQISDSVVLQRQELQFIPRLPNVGNFPYGREF